MKIASLFFILLGVALLAYALTLSPYKNREVFHQRYMQLTDGQSREYHALRDSMLTSKFQMQDYGGTLVTLGMVLFVISHLGVSGVRAPGAPWQLVVLAFLVPLLSEVAAVFDLFQGSDREEFPYWADSLGIPLSGSLVVLVLLWLWAFGHLALLRRAYPSGVPLVIAFSRGANRWLLFLSALTLAVIGMLLVAGQYWFLVPGFMWLYFYLSLAAARRSPQAPRSIALS